MGELNHSMNACALTKAEKTFLAVLADDLNIKRASETLGIGYKSALNRGQCIREKLCVSTTEEAVAIWRNTLRSDDQ